MTAQVQASTGVHPQIEALILADPLDFSNWVSLLSFVEENVFSVDSVKSVFNWFLSYFPLCWGYWVKYAKKVDSLLKKELKASGDSVSLKHTTYLTEVVDIYKNATSPTAVRYSVDIWLSYCQYMTSNYENGDLVREVFEEAVGVIGSHPHSGELWKLYISFEKQEGTHWESIYEIYRLALSQFLLSIPFFVEDTTLFLRDIDSPEVEKYLVEGASIAAQSYKQVSRRAKLEMKLTRSYYDVRPLELFQYSAWRVLLRFEENEYQQTNSIGKVIETYERCILVCANYSEIWLQYIDWCTSNVSVQKSLEIAHRACSILKFRMDVHFVYADLLEMSDQIALAREIHRYIVQHISGGQVQAVLKHASFEKRHGNDNSVEEAYREAIGLEISQTPPESTKAFLYIHMAKYFAKYRKDFPRMRNFFSEAVKAMPSRTELWLNWLNLESLDHSEGLQQRLVEVFVKSQICQKHINEKEEGELLTSLGDNPALSDQERAELWTSFIEILENLKISISDLYFFQSSYKRWLRRKSERSKFRNENMNAIITSIQRRFLSDRRIATTDDMISDGSAASGNGNGSGCTIQMKQHRNGQIIEGQSSTKRFKSGSESSTEMEGDGSTGDASQDKNGTTSQKKKKKMYLEKNVIDESDRCKVEEETFREHMNVDHGRSPPREEIRYDADRCLLINDEWEQEYDELMHDNTDIAVGEDTLDVNRKQWTMEDLNKQYEELMKDDYISMENDATERDSTEYKKDIEELCRIADQYSEQTLQLKDSES